jgi:hypothetical protein
MLVRQQRLDLWVIQKLFHEFPEHIAALKPVPVFGEAGRIPDCIIGRQSHEPAKQEIVVELLHQLALRAHAVEHLQEQGTQQLFRRDRWPALMRIEFAKAMAQPVQDLANELAYLTQRMIRRSPLLRLDIREQAALILKPSAHPHPPAESLREK